MIITIDPGHGGRDIGTMALGTPEKDYNMELAFILYDIMGDVGLSPILTRCRDYGSSPRERGKISEKNKSDLVLSLHVNTSNNEGVHGAEAYYWSGNDRMIELGLNIVSHMPAQLRSAKVIGTRGDVEWMKHAHATLAAHKASTLLIEVGYGTNKQDKEFLLSEYGMAMVAMSITQGVLEWDSRRPGNKNG